MKNANRLALGVTSATLLLSLQAQAQFDEEAAPRGRAVEALASYCSLGKIPQTGKVGHYTGLCDSLTDAEKCLAFIKRQMNLDNELDPAVDGYYQEERAQYCLSTFKKSLLGK